MVGDATRQRISNNPQPSAAVQNFTQPQTMLERQGCLLQQAKQMQQHLYGY